MTSGVCSSSINLLHSSILKNSTMFYYRTFRILFFHVYLWPARVLFLWCLELTQLCFSKWLLSKWTLSSKVWLGLSSFSPNHHLVTNMSLLPGGASSKEPTCQCKRWETRVQSLCPGDPLEKGIATHSSILTWRIP